MAGPVKPLRSLRLRTPRLELRLPTDAELLALAETARGGVHPPDEMPFRIRWTEGMDEPGWVDGFCGYHRSQLAAWSPERWALELVVLLDGEPVGGQTIFAEAFARTRAVETGGWLGLRFQNRGLGTEMRAAALELAFHGLGAERALSRVFADNPQSIRVSEKLGYRRVAEVAEPRPELRFELARADWRSPVPVAIEALEPALPLFGVTSGRSRGTPTRGRGA